MSIGLLLPAFNEESKIGQVIADIRSSVLGESCLIVVVDDGSTDRTAWVAREQGATVLSSPVNAGKGNSLRLGMEYLRGLGLDAYVWMDSDGQHRAESLESLVAPVLKGRASMVVGSRYLSDSLHKAPMNRRVVRKATIAVMRSLTGHQLTDPFSGFRCFSPEAAEAIDLCGDRYESELEATLCVARAGLTILEVAIPRVYGPDTSKMGYRKGAFLGRAEVISGYARTLARGWLDDKKVGRTASHA